MKVLLSGNSPNIQFYTSRFQTFKNIELFHVSDNKSNTFKLQTKQYGTVKYSLENHFTSLQNLIEGLKLISNDFKFNLIIFSVSSLKELANILNLLKSVIDNTKTKILIESSGYLPLESFLLNNKSNDSLQSNIFSILTFYDIRELNNNEYKQQQQSDSKDNYQRIILGKSSYPISNSKQIQPKYDTKVQSKLKDLASIFKKCFNQNDIITCNMEPKKFISEQWSMAIPNICLNPLMILFQESNIDKFLNEILAKPLISGLVTEILTVAKSSNILLAPNINNETHIIESWQSHYQRLGDIPPLVFNFKQNLSNHLNLDLLLLNPILLADDLSIKTPYLEFLYTVMIQYSNINERKANWFVRKENMEQLEQAIEGLNNDKRHILNKYHILQENFEKANIELTDIKNKIKLLELENVQLKQSNEIKLNEKDEIINDLKLKLSSSSSPNLNNDTHISNDQISTSTTQIESKELLNINMSIKERENQLVDRELALKKKELELDKKLATIQQQGQQIQLQQPLYINSMKTQVSPPLKSPASFNSPNNMLKPQPLPYVHSTSSNGNINRSNHSTPTLPNVSASKFVDPISSNLSPPLDITDNFQQLHHKPSFGSHPFKPTSRKNRKDNLPAIGNASSIGFNDVSTSPNLLSPVGRRVSSMPTQSTKFHTHNTLSEHNDLSRQGLGILNIPQPNKNVPLGISNNNHTTTTTNNNNNGTGSRNLTPSNADTLKQQTSKSIQSGSNNSTSNININPPGNINDTQLTPPPTNLFNSTPRQSPTSSPVIISHKFGKDEVTNSKTTNVQESASNEISVNGKENKSKKKFGDLFHRNKK